MVLCRALLLVSAVGEVVGWGGLLVGTIKVAWDRIMYGSAEDQFVDLYTPVPERPTEMIDLDKPLRPRIRRVGDIAVYNLGAVASWRRPRTAVLFIHGGYWRAQHDLSLMEELVHDLLDSGLEVANVEYRRVGSGGGWPDTFFDLAAAMDALYQAGVRRVITVGHSAGGQLALWLAAVSERSIIGPEAELHSSVQVSAAVSLAGLNDLRLGWELDLSAGAVQNFIGGTPTEFPDRYSWVSPIELIPMAIPILLVHGRMDANVPIEMTLSYAAAGRAIGDSVDLLEMDDEDHFDVIRSSSRSWSLARTWIISRYSQLAE